MKHKTKSYFYLASCILGIVFLITICFITPLPNNYISNILRILIACSCMFFYVNFNIEHNKADYSQISFLRKQYPNIVKIVESIANSVSSSEEAHKLDLIINQNDDYLLSFQNNIRIIEEYHMITGKKSEIKIITVACLLDALSSKPGMFSTMSNDPNIQEVIYDLNLQFAISVILYILNVTFESDKYIDYYCTLLKEFIELYGTGSVSSIQFKIAFLEFMANITEKK